MIRIFSAVIIFLVVAVSFTYILGRIEPVSYKGELAEHFDETPLVIWDTLVDPKRIPQVKDDVKRVVIIEDNRGLMTWDEELSRGRVRKYRAISKNTPSKYVVELYESTDLLTGTWTYFLQTQENVTGTTVLVQEESETKNTLLRGINKLRGRDVYLRKALKSIRVGLFSNLLNTP